MAANELLSLLLSPQHNVFYELSHSGNFSQHRIANQVILQNVTTPIAAVPRMRIVVDGSWLSVGDRTSLAWVYFDTDNQRVYEEAILGPPMLSPQQNRSNCCSQGSALGIPLRHHQSTVTNRLLSPSTIIPKL
ncbi:unnamed protein product [Camellia sinensis]